MQSTLRQTDIVQVDGHGDTEYVVLHVTTQRVKLCEFAPSTGRAGRKAVTVPADPQLFTLVERYGEYGMVTLTA